jgi:CheY-like chemotaxis protein
MGGEINLQSTPGIGSTFTIHLTHVMVAESQPQETSRRVSLARQVQFKSAKILVADDVESNRHLVKSTLEEHGLHVIEALDGNQAVALCKELHPHLVMMDIRMPNMDGIEAIQQIRQYSTLAHIPVVAMTAGPQNEEHLKLFQGFLHKPMTPTDIIVELQMHLAHRTVGSTDTPITQAPELSNIDRETLIKTLDEKTLSLWRNAMESGVFDDVKMFAEALHCAGVAHHIHPLCEYAESVLESVENFDVRKLRGLLSQFTELIPDEEKAS